MRFFHVSYFLKGSRQENGYYTVFLAPDNELIFQNIYVLKRILHKKMSIFMQLLESPIPPDQHLQEAGPSGSSFETGLPLLLTTKKRA